MTKIIVHSKTTKDEIVEKFGCDPKNISVIHHGPLGIEFVRTALEDMTRKSLMRQSLPKLTILGNIRRNKGVIQYLELWKIANQTFPEIVSEAQLHIIGQWDTAYLTEVEHFVRVNNLENVFISNKWLSNDEFSNEVVSSDVCVLPDTSISQSGVLMTLISYRKPFIVADIGGLSDPLKVAKVGWFFSWSDDFKERTKKAVLIPIQDIRNGWKPSQEDWIRIDNYFSWTKAVKLAIQTYKSATTGN